MAMSLPDGLYSVQFQTPLGAGAGVILLENGIARGGDAGIYYAGTYKQDDTTFSADIKIGRHCNIAGTPSVFGVDDAAIVLKGTSAGDKATVTGTSPQAPGISFGAKLTRIPV
jgi:hypothetical protein